MGVYPFLPFLTESSQMLRGVINFHPHPYGTCLEIEGLSHAGKTVHWTVFYSAFRVHQE